MEVGERVRAKSRRVFERGDGVEDKIRGERGEGAVEGAGVDGAEDTTGEGVLGVGIGGGILFVKTAGYGGSFG